MILLGGLGISKLQFWIKKINKNNSSFKFFSIFGYQTIGPDQQLEKMLDPDHYPDPH